MCPQSWLLFSDSFWGKNAHTLLHLSDPHWNEAMCILNEWINPDSHLINAPQATKSAWRGVFFIVEERESGGRETGVAIGHPLQRESKEGFRLQKDVGVQGSHWKARIGFLINLLFASGLIYFSWIFLFLCVCVFLFSSFTHMDVPWSHQKEKQHPSLLVLRLRWFCGPESGCLNQIDLHSNPASATS